MGPMNWAGKSDEDVLRKILAEDATHKIADSLGMEPEEYAKRVLFYIRNPKAQPQLNVLSPAAEKAAGVPSVDECLDYVDKLASGEIPMGDEHERTRFAGFGDDEKSGITAVGGKKKLGAERAPPLPGETTSSSSAAPRPKR